MKRSGPPKRKKALERRTPLVSSNEGLRKLASTGASPDLLEAARKGLERRTRMERRTTLKPGRRRRLSADEKALAGIWIVEVKKAAVPPGESRPRCQVCGSRKRLTGHHVVPQELLRIEARKRGVPEAELVWDPRIGLLVCWDGCHYPHEQASRRIPLRALRSANIALASDLGFDWYIEKHYPIGGDPRLAWRR